MARITRRYFSCPGNSIAKARKLQARRLARTPVDIRYPDNIAFAQQRAGLHFNDGERRAAGVFYTMLGSARYREHIAPAAGQAFGVYLPMAGAA